MGEYKTLLSAEIEPAIQWLQRGDLVAIPTETVYGLAANALNEIAVRKIFQVKGRPYYDPLIVHTNDIRKADQWITAFPQPLKMLAEAFWPGPLTLLLPKKPVIPDLVTAGLNRVGMRIPDHPLTLRLLQALEFPLAAPSANPFGYVSPTMAIHVMSHFQGEIPMILDGGACPKGIESTIVGMEDHQVVIYRLGALSRAAVEAIAGRVHLQRHSSSRPTAPGMLTKHYAPNKRVIVVGDTAEAKPFIKSPEVALITFSRPIDQGYRSVWLSAKRDLDEAAARFYATLQQWDHDPAIETIVVERFPDESIGQALNDKLQRAAQQSDL
ncbi:MAG: threonylcarbamoyl-AMP synthase [Saprospiraceae bacterium]|nr:threonylcarbamoyl-AMP synthase [Saprospiraceae bacterium]